MKGRKFLIAVFILTIFPRLVFSKELYSTISTSFQLKKRVSCDRLIMKFRVWANGNTFPEALKRLKPINNEFLAFLKKIYPLEQIKTQMGYGGERSAAIIITIDTNKVNSAGRVLKFISNKHFPYQTGINISKLTYTVSNKKMARVKALIFKEALLRCKQLLKITNSILKRTYYVSSINISYGGVRAIYNEPQRNILFKASSKPIENGGIKTNPGQKLIKATVSFSAISKIE